uniref:Dynein heavy chain tail domain-containing protein n=1 Tax=Electrophorus electricus TaxID=8005 RepID=A0AAY5EZK9_ELEEL
MEEEDSPAVDKRFYFIEQYVLKTMKLKPDRWHKCLSVEEQKQVIQDFLDKSDNTTLVVSLNAAGQLIPTFGFAGYSKNKSVYFIKRNQGALSSDTMQTDLLYGDMSPSPLEQFSAFVEEVAAPVLLNARNHSEWPHVVSQDVKRHVQALKNSVFVVAGQVKGKTLLPLPPGSERLEQTALESEKREDLLDKSVIHVIESMVIEWSHQIHEVLKRDSSEPLLLGINPTPHMELNFWKNRYADLECIHEQFKSPKVARMAELLDTMDSSYYPAFRNMLQDVMCATSGLCAIGCVCLFRYTVPIV